MAMAAFRPNSRTTIPLIKVPISMIDKGQRIIIEQVSVTSGGAEVSIELKYADQIYKGMAQSGPNEHAQMLAAANALINAVNSIIPTPIVTRVRALQQVRFQSISELVVVTLVAI